ncbi:MAG: hypothetical protein ACO1SX_28270, partial [Actinomycetota bacterium]
HDGARGSGATRRTAAARRRRRRLTMSETRDESQCQAPGCTEDPRKHGRVAGWCSYHTPCSECGEPWGPVGHYAMPGCRSGGLKRDGTGFRAHCTCDGCY